MGKLVVFNTVSVDGYFTRENGDMSWAHAAPDDAEWNEFVAGNAQGGGILLLGRVTYDMMASWWPKPQAAAAMPEVADGMNRMPKYVFSKTMDKAEWSNTTVLKGDIATETRKLKDNSSEGIAILGSGSIVAQLTQAGLIDEFQIVVKPIVLGSGKTMFEGVGNAVNLQRTQSRAFKNGNVLLCYTPG